MGRARRPRSSERFQTDLLSCTLGAIVNLSSSGIRLRCSGKSPLQVGQVLPVTLSSPQSRLTLPARVVWIHRRLLRGKEFDMGLQFVDIRPHMAQALKCLAQFGFIPRTEGVQAATPVPPTDGGAGEPDYYELLGVACTATTQEIHDAYRAMARKYHPDHNKSPEATTQFDTISRAYRVLRDAERREAYDRLRRPAA